MNKIRLLGWSACFVLAWTLVAFTALHGNVEKFATAHRNLAFYAVIAALLAVPANLITFAAAYIIELQLVGWSRSSLKLLFEPRASVRLDLLSVIVMELLPHKRVGYLLSLGLLYVFDTHAAHSSGMSATALLPWWGLQVLFILLFHSMVLYWVHRLEHTIPALWALHQFHHTADHMSILTAERQTYLLVAVDTALAFLPMYLVTAPTAAVPKMTSPAFLFVVIYLVYQIFIKVNGHLCHSNLKTDYGWLGRWLLVSPAMHRLHHAKAPTYYNKNFAFEFVFWDKLFGTYMAPSAALDDAAIPIGLDDNPFNARGPTIGVLRGYFVTSYAVLWNELRKGVRAWIPISFDRRQES